MSMLVMKSPFFKCGIDSSLSRYMSYIATRENAEILPDERPATKQQEKLIKSLLHDYPDSKDLLEYDDWVRSPTKAHASALIRTALECHWQHASHSDIYMKYIATRPRTERLGSHGLFGDEDNIDLQKAMSALDGYTGKVWTHILSLSREDAERLSFNHAGAWRNLLRVHRDEISQAMNIPPEHFRWYAAFHDEGDHPHVHMMAWSDDPREGYLNEKGIRTIRSKLTNEIFRNEMLHVYEQKSVSRQELVQEARKTMRELAKEIQEGLCSHPEAEQLILELSTKLNSVKGKKKYGYLPKELKVLVNSIVDLMEQLPSVHACYEHWQELQGQVDGYYSDKVSERKIPLSQQKEFRQIKNAVIQAAEFLQNNYLSFEDKEPSAELDEGTILWASNKYWKLQAIIDAEDVSIEEKDDAVQELMQIAESGDPHAQYLVGILYRDGGILTPNTEFACMALEDAARNKITAAQYALGVLLLSDDPDVHNSALGIKWLEHAYENGFHHAGYRLAKEYLTGKNTEQNIHRAAEILETAAEYGNQYAQYLLGKILLSGKELPIDKDAAVYWLTMSADQGNAYAELLLKRMDQRPEVILSVIRLFHHMGRIFQENSLPRTRSTTDRIDRKRLKQLQRKRQALGHNKNDHPDQGLSLSY